MCNIWALAIEKISMYNYRTIEKLSMYIISNLELLLYGNYMVTTW